MAQLKFTTRVEGFDTIAQRLAQAGTAAEHALAETVAADTERFVPFKTGMFVNDTKVVGNQIIYPGPYARYLYFGKVMVNAATGKGPMVFVDSMGNEQIRFPKGAKLRATDRNLVFTRDYHPDAQAFWFEASKRINLDKWKKTAEKLLIDEYKHK